MKRRKTGKPLYVLSYTEFLGFYTVFALLYRFLQYKKLETYGGLDLMECSEILKISKSFR